VAPPLNAERLAHAVEAQTEVAVLNEGKVITERQFEQ
jgi:hypothetical protein